MGAGLSYDPVFSDDGKRFAVRFANRPAVAVWDVETKSQIALSKSEKLSDLTNFSLNANGTRLVMAGSAAGGAFGLYDVLDVESGDRISRIKIKGGSGQDVLLSPDGKKVFTVADLVPGILSLFPDGSRIFKPYPGHPGPGLAIWDAETGVLLERHDHGANDDFMVTGLSRSRDGLVAINFMAKSDAEERGLSDFLWLWNEGGMQKMETGLTNSTAIIAPDSNQIFVAGTCLQQKTSFALSTKKAVS